MIGSFVFYYKLIWVFWCKISNGLFGFLQTLHMAGFVVHTALI